IERTAMPMWLIALTGFMVELAPLPRGEERDACWPRQPRSLPGFDSLELDEDLALLDRVTDVDIDLGDPARDRRRNHPFHVHRFQTQQSVIHLDRLAGLGRNLGDRAGKRAAATLALISHRGTAGRRRRRRRDGGRTSRNPHISWRRIETGLRM